MKKFFRIVYPVSIVTVGGILSPATLVHAQAAGVEAAGVALEEIVVTAQKRSERQIDVPISMAVLDGAALTQQAAVNLQDITATVPGVNLAMDTGTRRVYIRGIGSGSNGGFEQSVGQFVDGVYHGRSLMSSNMQFDVERIEVLKGPQSTFFGNNTVAGAISVVTKQPGQDTDISVSALYEPNQNERNIDAVMGGALGSALSGRLAVRYYANDGWLKNLNANNKTFPRNDGYAVRGSLRWQPDESFDATLKVEQGRIDTDGALAWQMVKCPPDANVAPGPTGPACGIALGLVPGFESSFDDRFSASAGQQGWLDTNEYALTLNKQFDGLTLTSVTAHSDYDNLGKIDADNSSLNLIHVADFEKYRQLSQELRLSSPTDQPLSWIAGAYYQRGELDKNIYINLPIATLPPPTSALPPFPSVPVPVELDNFAQSDHLVSAFGALSWRVTDQLKADVGLRWSRVTKKAQRSIDGGLNNTLLFDVAGFSKMATGAVENLARTDSSMTPSLGVQYYFTPDVVGYAKYARGWKAGGYSQTLGEDQGLGFAPEVAQTYELGVKATNLADGRLRANLAVFLSKFKDLQQSNFVGFDANFSPKFLIQNVGKAESKGVEFDFAWAVTDRLTVDGGLELLNAESRDYRDGPCGIAVPVCLAGSPTQDLSGKTLPYSAPLSGNLGLVYDQPLGSNLGLRTDASVFATRRYYTMATLDPNTIQPGFYKLDVRMELHDNENRWFVALVGKNLNNVYTSQWSSDVATSPGTYFKILDRTRSIALQVGRKF